MDNLRDSTSDEFLRLTLLEAESATPQAVPSVTAEGLLTAARRRRRRRATSGAVIVSLMAVGATFGAAVWRPIDMQEVASLRSPSPAMSPAMLVWLARDAALQEQVIRGLRNEEASRRRQWELASDVEATSDLIHQEIARSAAIGLQYAAIIEQESGDAGRARDEYLRIEERFPGTTWATLAASSAERLSTATRN
jgi:hypothetical protein